jgi:hypothetical protein
MSEVPPTTGGFDWGGLLKGVGSLVGGAALLLAGNANSQALQDEAQGYQAEGDLFGQAQVLEQQNAVLAGAAGDIQIAQQNSKNYKLASATVGATAGAGFQTGGSFLDVLRENTEQGSLATGMLQVQKGINVNTYNTQAMAYGAEQQQAYAEEAAAKSSAGSTQTGGVLGAIGGVLSAAASFLPLIRGL